MAAVTIKRKRGRPRRDEPSEINDFDIALIREFENRPAFYDRSCVHYRNRDYIEQQWEEMAKNLGYPVSLIRERMIQLRNRYNLEKRRVEAMQDQYDDPDITSQWPLYEHMTFLGDHIKSRRPYINSKSAILSNSVRAKRSANSNSSNDDDEYEESQNSSNDTEQQENSNIIKKSRSLHLENESNSDSRLYFPAPMINDNINTTIAADSHHHQQQQNQININPQLHQIRQQNSVQRHQQLQSYEMQPNQRPHKYEPGVEKFLAFGQFLAASLIEMNEIDALRLVDKFTSELVRHACMDAEVKANASPESDDETEDVNLSV